MFSKLKDMFFMDVSIDLGTANTLVYVKNKGILIDEPSIVAVKDNRASSLIIAVGNEAKRMLGKTPGSITAIRPLKDGVIADFSLTEKMLQHFMKKIQPRGLFKPIIRVLVCVPCKATQVERRAIKESVLGAGARYAYLIDEPLAAAIGAGLDVEQPIGSMVLDIGGGTSEIAIITMGGTVYSESVRVAGDKFDTAIIAYVKRKFGILIGEITAERIKKEIGTAFPEANDDSELEIRGRSLTTGTPKAVIMKSIDVFEALREPLAGIIQAIKIALEKSPPELASDISETGIVLTGGGALLRGLDKLINEETGLPVVIADEPLTCVARGGGRALELFDDGKFQILFDDE